MYRTAGDLKRGHGERMDHSSRERGAKWDEHTQVELHEKLKAARNRSRFGLGFVPNGNRSSAAAVELQRTCGSATSSSNSSSSYRRSSSSSRHAFGGSSNVRQATVEERLPSTCPRSKLESSSAPRPRHSGGTERVERYNWTSDNCSRKRSKSRSSGRSGTSAERRKRSRSRTSEARCHNKDALQTCRRDDRQREVRMGENSLSASEDACEVHIGEKGAEIRKKTLGCQGVTREAYDSRKLSLQMHSGRRSRSGGTHGSEKERSPSYTREGSTRLREQSPHEYGRPRKGGGDLGKTHSLREADNIRGRRSSSGNSAHRRDEERETRYSSRRAKQEAVTRHKERYECDNEKGGTSVSLIKPGKESTSHSRGCLAPTREQSSFAKDKELRTRGGRAGGRETSEIRCSRANSGGRQCREAFPRDAGPSNYGDKEGKQHADDGPTAAAVDASDEKKRRGGIVPGRTAMLPTLCHGSAQEALKQRIRERLREVEERQGKCSEGEIRGNRGSEAKPVLTAREGRLISWKQLITAESQEAFERGDSRSSWNAVLDRQGKEQVDEDVQRILEHEDETRFSAFLERKRREKLQAAEICKAARTAESRCDTGDADPERKESGIALSGNHRGEGSHLEAIFGRSVPDSVKRNEGQTSQASATLCRTTASAAEVVTTTLPGLKGMALLADAVVMQSGNSEAGWKLRRQLQRQQKLGQ